MNPQNEPSKTAGGIIRLTSEELSSGHVDDLLKRQMSMRGGGVSRNERKWYYRSWFVFMVVGMLAAVLAWAIVEPRFDDMCYLQGPIEQMETRALAAKDGSDSGTGVLLKIRGQAVLVSSHTKDLSAKERPSRESVASLRVGQEIGVHTVLPRDAKNSDVTYAAFIETNPPVPAPGRAQMPVERQMVRQAAFSFLLFPLVAGLVGLFIGGVDGLICRLPRRALLGGGIGLAVGIAGSFVATILAGLIYTPINHYAEAEMNAAGTHLTTLGFVLQMLGRTLAWGAVGMTMGIGQGIALRSKRLLLYGFIGGVLGGLLGGLLFDPIDLLLLGADKPSAHISRLIGLAVIGAATGAMIGIVELLARDAWLRMTEGPLAGKEFLMFKDTMKLGSSPRSDIYLFNDDQVSGLHATLRTVGDDCELENNDDARPALVNGRPVRTARLRHGDRITIGRTSFVFEKRQG